METKVKFWPVRRLIDLHNQQIMYIEEYQRGARWNSVQVLLFIDSVMRGYQIPMIYAREIGKGDDPEYGGKPDLGIVDGQQRINSLQGFQQGVVFNPNKKGSTLPSLFDPAGDPAKNNGDFPESIKDAECPWANKKYSDFPDDMKEKFLSAQIPVAVMKDKSKNNIETRDMFIRLQGGVPLKPQEIRDSWPGNFCALVRKIGGVPRNQEQGHDFFQKLVKTPQKDCGEIRQVVAHLLMLMIRKHEENPQDYLIKYSPELLDKYYIRYVDLSEKCSAVKRLNNIIQEMYDHFRSAEIPPLKAHWIAHTALFWDDLLDENNSDHKKKEMAGALRAFIKKLDEVKSIKVLTGHESIVTKNAWQYMQMIKGQGFGKERHRIYEHLMLHFLNEGTIHSSQAKD